MSEYELYHHGVKGMKWGVRKKRESSSDHNKNYSDKQRKRDRAFYGKRGEKRINKKLNEGYGLQGARHHEVERKDRAEKNKKLVRKGAKSVAKTLSKLAMMSLVDDVFYGGAGKKAAKEVINGVGRAAVTAFTMARGGYDIKWYDKRGRRVG